MKRGAGRGGSCSGTTTGCYFHAFTSTATLGYAETTLRTYFLQGLTGDERIGRTLTPVLTIYAFLTASRWSAPIDEPSDMTSGISPTPVIVKAIVNGGTPSERYPNGHK